MLGADTVSISRLSTPCRVLFQALSPLRSQEPHLGASWALGREQKSTREEHRGWGSINL